jgi:glycosyltransferase involved in cell wall biosynthesis
MTYDSQKIIINVNILWGAVNFRLDLMNQLISSGYNVVVVGSTDEFSRISLSTLRAHNIQHHKIKLNRKNLNPINDLLYICSLIKIFQIEKPDYILNYTIKPNIFGSIAAIITSKRYINTVNGLGSAIINETILARVLRFMYKIAFIKSQEVLFQNPDDLNYFVSRSIVKNDIAEIVPGSGVDTRKYDMPIINQNKVIKFNFIGRILKDKGVLEYIEAIRLLRLKYPTRAKYYLSGFIDDDNPSGIDRTNIGEWEKEGLIVYQPKTDNIMEYLKHTDVIVLPSYREGLSKMLIEAGSCRKPLITTNVPGCKQLISSNMNGYVCEAKDPIGLASIMGAILESSLHELMQMGENSRNHIKDNYSNEKVFAIYMKLIEDR